MGTKHLGDADLFSGFPADLFRNALIDDTSEVFIRLYLNFKLGCIKQKVFVIAGSLPKEEQYALIKGTNSMQDAVTDAVYVQVSDNNFHNFMLVFPCACKYLRALACACRCP